MAMERVGWVPDELRVRVWGGGEGAGTNDGVLDLTRPWRRLWARLWLSANRLLGESP